MIIKLIIFANTYKVLRNHAQEKVPLSLEEASHFRITNRYSADMVRAVPRQTG